MFLRVIIRMTSQVYNIYLHVNMNEGHTGKASERIVNITHVGPISLSTFRKRQNRLKRQCHML